MESLRHFRKAHTLRVAAAENERYLALMNAVNYLT